MLSDTRVIHVVQTLKLRPEIPSESPRISFFDIHNVLLATCLFSFFHLFFSYFLSYYSDSSHHSLPYQFLFVVVIFFHRRKVFADIIRECWCDGARQRPSSIQLLEKLEAAVESFAFSIPDASVSFTNPINNSSNLSPTNLTTSNPPSSTTTTTTASAHPVSSPTTISATSTHSTSSLSTNPINNSIDNSPTDLTTSYPSMISSIISSTITTASAHPISSPTTISPTSAHSISSPSTNRFDIAGVYPWSSCLLLSSSFSYIVTAVMVTTLAGSGEQGFKDGEGLEASFHWPHGICINRHDGYLYVCEQHTNAIRRVSMQGIYILLTIPALPLSFWFTTISAGGVTTLVPQNSLNNPIGIVFNHEENVFYVSNCDNHTILKITSSGMSIHHSSLIPIVLTTAKGLWVCSLEVGIWEVITE